MSHFLWNIWQMIHRFSDNSDKSYSRYVHLHIHEFLTSKAFSVSFSLFFSVDC